MFLYQLQVCCDYTFAFDCSIFCVCVYRCARQVANAQEYVRVCVELLNRRILICLCKCFANNHVDLVNVTYIASVWISAVHVFINLS